MFGTTIGGGDSVDKLKKYCTPGVQRAADGDPYAYVVLSSNGHVPGAYQTILEMAREKPHVEALVFLHTDFEILDPMFARKVRFAINGGFDVVGLVGTNKLTSLYWWEHGQPSWRGYAEDGRDGRTVVDGGFSEGDPCPVASVDGMLFVLSRWAIDNVSFVPDEYPGLHAYAEEACMQVTKAGRHVCVTRIGAFHATSGGYAGGEEAFARANETFKRRWSLG